jgi:stearoyl-CoA desaturase (delta-9 desaturase)
MELVSARAKLRQEAAQRRHALLLLIAPALGAVLTLGLADRFRWSEWVGFGVLSALTMVGITVGFHRHFAHGSFKAPAPVRAALAVLGSMSAQGTLAYWVSVHRQHHAISDEDGDPHSPRPRSGESRVHAFWRAHASWTIHHPHPETWKLVRDLLGNRLLWRVNRGYPIWVACGLLAPAALSAMIHQSLLGAVYGIVCGGLARIFVVFHITSSVNSVCHLIGSRPYDTRDQSRNSGWLALPTLGESWHNNHHAFPTSARMGLAWWQIDISAAVIHGLESVGLASDVKRATPSAQERSHS